MHTLNFIHCNIKPSHLLFSTGVKRGMLHLIDFTFTRMFQHCATHHHVAYKKQLPFVSTACFTSIRALSGKKQSHRDDLESLTYIFLYLLSGSLSWQDRTLSITEVIQVKKSICQSHFQSCIPTAFFFLS